MNVRIGFTKAEYFGLPWHTPDPFGIEDFDWEVKYATYTKPVVRGFLEGALKQPIQDKLTEVMKDHALFTRFFSLHNGWSRDRPFGGRTRKAEELPCRFKSSSNAEFREKKIARLAAEVNAKLTNEDWQLSAKAILVERVNDSLLFWIQMENNGTRDRLGNSFRHDDSFITWIDTLIEDSAYWKSELKAAQKSVAIMEEALGKVEDAIQKKRTEAFEKAVFSEESTIPKGIKDLWDKMKVNGETFKTRRFPFD